MNSGAKNDKRVVIEQSTVLVVEGRDDEFFFRAFIDHLKLGGIQILSIGGKSRLKDELEAIIKTPGFSNVISLGIVRDADVNPISAFQGVCDVLRSLGLPTPSKPLMPVGFKPKVVVMVLPGEEPGALEDLCLKSVEEDPVMTCVEQYFQCLQQKGISLPRNMSKAKVQVFLASKPRAGLRLGEAAQAGYWPLESEVFRGLREFINKLVKG